MNAQRSERGSGGGQRGAARVPLTVPVKRKAVKRERLGPLTNSASPQGSKTYKKNRAARYKLQELASQMLPGHRVCGCGWRPQKDSQIGISRRGGRHFISGVTVCGSIWACPVCAAKIALQRAQELEQAVEAWTSQGGSVWLLTLTIDHVRKDSLENLLSRFTKAMSQLWAGKWGKGFRNRYGQRGIVRNLECTWGFSNGWHPHCHAILFVRSGLHLLAQHELKEQWIKVSARYGFKVSYTRGANLEQTRDAKAAAEYATKSDEGGTWGMAQELTWANIKKARGTRYTPFALLAACDSSEVSGAPALFQEYADAFKGRRQLYWSKGLRAALQLDTELSDEDIANSKDDEAVFVAAIDTPIFCWIKARGLLCDLLDAADDGGLEAINSFLEWSYDCRRYESRITSPPPGGAWA